MPVSLIGYLERFLERREAYMNCKKLRPRCTGKHYVSCVIAVKRLKTDGWSPPPYAPLRKMFFARCVPDQHTRD